MKSKMLWCAMVFTMVAPALGSPSIVTQPTAQIAYVGSSATFMVVASGTAPLSYQWQIYSTIFHDLQNQTNAQLTLAKIRASDAADYRVVVTDASGSTNSATAHLFVAQPKPLSILQVAPSVVTLSWAGNMVLLQSGLGGGDAEAINCPAWVRIADTSPVTLTNAATRPQFFRLVALPSAAELGSILNTNLAACRELNGKACEDCVAAYLMSAPLESLQPSPEMEEAASDGSALGSCISAAQLDILVYIRFLRFGP